MSVARSYAAALFQAAQSEKLDATSILRLESELISAARAVAETRELRQALCGPVVTAKEKAAVIEAVGVKMGWLPLLTRFLVLAAKKGRAEVLSEIARAFSLVRIEASGGLRGHLESADPLSDADVAELSAAFSKQLGKTIEFTRQVRPDLLAGVKVTVGGTTYDGTLSAQLGRLREKFTNSSISTH